ncbi:MAG: hypothetical protein AB7F36_14405 [Reyranellaceae bacterium]
MTAKEVLDTLLARIGASHDGTIFVDDEEVRKWPKGPVASLAKAGILTRAEPAKEVICDGCERRCSMPVEIVRSNGRTGAFVVCDKRDDINRVNVPLDRLERWHAGGLAIATFLAGRLGANRAASIPTRGRQWAVGMVRGPKKVAPVVLSVVDLLVLELGGHAVPLEEVLSLTAQGLVLKRGRLEECIDSPKRGGRRAETPEQRRQRLRAAIEREKAKGNRAAVQTVADEDGITRQMLHKIVREPKKVSM